MKTGFQLVKTRSINEPTSYVVGLEEKYDVKLPPLFRLCYETFEMDLEKTRGAIIYFPDDYVCFSDIHKTIDFGIEALNISDVYKNYNMLCFASSGLHTGGICVCVSGEHKDKIFVEDEMHDGELGTFRFIANNIFEFVRGLIEIPAGSDGEEFYLK
jgi:hypothetical protein